MLGSKGMDGFGQVWAHRAALRRIFITPSEHKVVRLHKRTAINGQSSCAPNSLTDLKMQSRFLDCLNEQRANTAREDKLPFAISFNT